MRKITIFRKPANAEDEVIMKDVQEIKSIVVKHENNPVPDTNDDAKRALPTKASERSWDSMPSICNSASTVGSSATLSTLKHFGLSNHPGKSAEDVTIDAFMDIGSDKEKKITKNNPKAKISFPQSSNLQFSDKHKQALSCIRSRDFDHLLKIVEATPEILLYQCKKYEVDTQQQSDGKPHLRGCYGGTILHVLVSQKPVLKKKRIKSNTRPIKDRVKMAIAFSRNVRNSIQLHVMPSVPHTIVRHIIKLVPESLFMTDDFGRLPIHCAILAQSVHLEEVNNLYGTNQGNIAGKFCRDVSFVVRELNLVQLLIKANPSSVTIGDLKGNLPLHYAVSIGRDYFESNNIIFEKSDKYRMPSASETVRLLLEANPLSVTIHNGERNLPIHHMISMKGPHINLSSLKLMMTYHSLCKDVLKERNRDGDPPLFLAIKSRASVEVIKMFASVDSSTSSLSKKLFSQRDGSNNNPLHVALRLTPRVDLEILRTIMNLAPFTACQPDNRNRMPIRYATEQDLPIDIIQQMLSRDMPIKIGSDNYCSERSNSGLARHVIGKSHHNSFWHIMIECNDKYLSMIKAFLMEQANYSQIVTLARQVGPDGNSILINCISDKCRLVFHSLLRFYDRYEILLSSKDVKIKPDDILDGVQTFLALDHGLSTELPSEECFSKLHKTSSDLSVSSEQSISTAIRVRNEKNQHSEVEVSLLSKEKSKVVLRCYQHEEAYFAEVKVREKYDFPREYYEELYNYHRDENYTFLALSRREKLCCITFERPDHTLAEVFASVSSGGQRSQKWIEKCWIVLKQLASSLKYLHNQNLIHGHLDAQNIAKYGNTWKIGKLGTVTEIGSRMRGKFRPCVPPESLVLNTSTTNLYIDESDAVRSSSGHRVKFSQSVDNCAFDKCQNHADSRDDLANVPRGKESTRQGTERSDLMTFFAFAGRSFDPKYQKGTSILRQPTTTTTRKKESLSRVYFVPERCEATRQWDMWGFGLLMVQLLLGRCIFLPNFEKAEDAVLKKLLNYDSKALQKICDELRAVAGNDASDLARLLLQKDPSLRPKSMEEVLAHKYFQVLTIYV